MDQEGTVCAAGLVCRREGPEGGRIREDGDRDNNSVTMPRRGAQRERERADELRSGREAQARK